MDRGTTIWPEKTYTQGEVDVLLEQKNEAVLSRSAEVKKETQTADRQERLEEKTVENLIKKSNRVVISISSVFPFDLFPNTITVEEGRITVVIRHLLTTAMHSVDLKDISNVFINKSIFFSQIEIASRTFENNEVRIKFLRNKDASFLRRMIEGLRIFESKQIDTSGYSIDELIVKLGELSTTVTSA